MVAVQRFSYGKMRINKKKLAFCSPLPPAPSGIAQWSGRILPILAAGFEVTVFTDTADTVTSADVSACYSVESLKHFPLAPSSKDFDLVLYQIGSNKLHAGIYLSAVLRPGIAMLHESVLHHLVKATTVGIGENAAYTDEMTRYYGREGAEIARLVHTGRAASETLYFHYPLFHRITERSRALITTTAFSKEMVGSEFPSKAIYHVPISACLDAAGLKKPEARARLDIKDEYIIGIFGLISPVKQIEAALDAVKSIAGCDRSVRLVLAGDIHDKYDVRSEIEKRGMENSVIITGRLDDVGYRDWLAAADICINLRYPTGGESSSALIEMMDAGKPVILPAFGQFLEIPSGAAVHINPGKDVPEQLRKVIEHLMENRDEAEKIGLKAFEFSIENFNLERNAARLIETLDAISALDPPQVPPLNKDEEESFHRLRNHFLTHPG